jgi:hypothetical protein
MRRILTLTCAVTLLLAPAASAHHKPKHKPDPVAAVATLAGSVTVEGVGAVSVDVLLPAAGELVLPIVSPTSPGWASVSTDGTWATVALISEERTFDGSGNPEGAYEVSLVGADGCPAAVPAPVAETGCLRPYNAVAWATTRSPRLVDGAWHYVYEPGRYRLVVATEPGRQVSASFRVAGLTGAVELVAADPVDVTFDRTRVEDPALAVLSGAFAHTATRPTIGLVGLWFTSAGDEPGEFEYSECVTQGEAAPLNPSDCVPTGLTGTAAPAGLGKQPVWFAGSYGGFSLTNSNLVAFQVPRLAPADYTNSFRVTRGGRGPAVGTFAVWIAD